MVVGWWSLLNEGLFDVSQQNDLSQKKKWRKLQSGIYVKGLIRRSEVGDGELIV